MILRSALSVLLLALALVNPAAAKPAAVEVPFSFDDGFIVVQARTPQGTTLNLLIDSGAGISMLDLRAAATLKIALGEPEPVRGVGCVSEAYHVAPLLAEAGGAALSEIRMAMDLSRSDELCSQPIHGLLGMDFFVRYVVQIDYAEKKLRLYPGGTELAASRYIPLQPINGMMMVPVSVDGSRDRFVRLDTGCNDALHWVRRRAPGRGRSRGVSVGFVTEEHQKVETTVRIAGVTMSGVVTAMHDRELFPGEAGLLGNALLCEHLTTIDAGRGFLLLSPRD